MKTIIRNNKSANVEVSADRSDLVLIAIQKIAEKGEVCTFERLVAECYRRFPRVFAFKRYPNWPDSSLVHTNLKKFREAGLVVGTPMKHVELTAMGNERLKTCYIGTRKVKEMTPLRQTGSAEDRIISFLQESPAYQRYRDNPRRFKISESEFRNILRCTLESPVRIVHQNALYVRKLAQSYNDKQLVNFLSVCSKRVFKRS